MEVLVTGGLGFIGANLVPELQKQGMSVRIFDSGLQSVGRRFTNVRIIEGDVRDEFAVARAVQGADIVIHLAAAGSVVDSVINPRTNFDVNAGVPESLGNLAPASTVQSATGWRTNNEDSPR